MYKVKGGNTMLKIIDEQIKEYKRQNSGRSGTRRMSLHTAIKHLNKILEVTEDHVSIENERFMSQVSEIQQLKRERDDLTLAFVNQSIELCCLKNNVPLINIKQVYFHE